MISEGSWHGGEQLICPVGVSMTIIISFTRCFLRNNEVMQVRILYGDRVDEMSLKGTKRTL